MPARVSLVLSSFIYWVAVASAFTFTSSFDGWVGNSTHTLTWDVSNSDPTSYDLAIAHSNNVNVPGVILDGTLSMDWSMKIAIQIPSNGNHFLTFTLPPEVLPGFYYMVMQNGTSTPLTPTFLISSSATAASNSSMSVIPTPLSTLAPSAGTTTFESYVQVTATQSALATQNGRVITVKPSDVFSSAVVYTTIIVAGGEGKGTPPEKIQLIVGLVLGIVFLLTIPIVVWLILRYRRRPTNSGSGDDNLDKRPSPLDAENLVNSSTLDLLEPNTAVANPVSNSSPTSTEPIRHVWAIVDGQKRATAVPRYPTSAPSTSNPNPFADPVHLNAPRPQQLPRLAIPSNPAQSSSLPPTTTTSNGTILSGVNTSRASPSPMYSRNETSEASHLAPSLSAPHIQEKTVQARRQRPNPPRVLSPDEVSARIFVPGRAVDMGPLGRTRAGDVDENGLLPPDYSQATQPILPSHAT